MFARIRFTIVEFIFMFMIFLTLDQCFKDLNYMSAVILDVAINSSLFSIKVKIHEINVEILSKIYNGIV